MLIESLLKQSGVERSYLNWFAKTASKRYKVYQIEKRTGGYRTIEHPSRELKTIQRWLNKVLFSVFPVHENAMAYKKGTSIAMNAEKHLNSAFTLRLDFTNFFPTFSEEAIIQFLNTQNNKLGLKLSEADISFAAAISTRNSSLTIGSPSSPVITNAMMFDFDTLISETTSRVGLIYTRYADDLFISTKEPNLLKGIAADIEKYSREYPIIPLQINRKKTAYLSKRYNRSITGLVVTPDNKISIGRKRKREIKSMVYKFKKGNLEVGELSKLRGLIAFSMDVEPSFFQALKDKYQDEFIERILGRIE